jgi:hypothetical protein
LTLAAPALLAVRFTVICTDDAVALYDVAERLRLAMVVATGGVVTGGWVVVGGSVVVGGWIAVGGSFDVAAGVETELDESPLHADNMARRIHAAGCRKKRVFNETTSRVPVCGSHLNA